MEENGNEMITMNSLPPGTYRVEEDGTIIPAVNWQEAINGFKWDEGHKLLDKLLGLKGDDARLKNEEANSRRKHITWIISIAIIATGILTYYGQVSGEAFTGFLGVLIGHLLTRK